MSPRSFVLVLRGVFVLAALTIGVDALAQTPPTRYPWDTRPNLCLRADAASDPRCAWEAWPTWNGTRQRVADLYYAEEFALLERAMNELASSEKVFVSGDSPASAAYWAFRLLMPGHLPLDAHQEKIARWREALPASDYVTFAQARLLYARAWEVRGTGTAGSVSRESWELFSLRLQEAEQVLLKASDTLKGTPYWHNLLLAIVLDSPRRQSNPDLVFQEGVKRWPRYFELYELRLTRLVPKWGGSWEEVESFIDRSSRQLSASEGTTVYARLYVSLKNQGVTPEQTRMNWKRMNASFEELTNRYPDPHLKNTYASSACFARDKAAFSAAMAKLSPAELHMESWWSGHSYEACMRWAGI